MTFTYAIADLHGRFDLLEKALATIEANQTPGTVVFTGDYVDRGPQSKEIIARLMKGPPTDWRWVCLKGNHEDMMVDHVRTGADLGTWMANGGGTTLLSYGHRLDGWADPSVVDPKHIDWMDGLPLYHEDAHRLYVHAGVDPRLPLAEQSENRIIWMIYPQGFAGGWRGKFVVHGHHQFEDGPHQYEGRIDLDTFAWATGRLVIGVFDDNKAGGPIRLIEIKGEPDPRMRLAA